MSGFAAGLVAAVGYDAAGAVPDGLVPVLVALASGAIGMSIKNVFDSILSDEEDEGEAGGEDLGGDDLGGEDLGGDGGLMAEEGGDDLDELGGLGGGEEELGGLDEEGADLGGGGGGASTGQLENQVDELEADMEALESTVNTVRNENEQIGQQVDEVQENIRKLLDIYEMVTRGVNPFADDMQGAGGGPAMDSGGFGLFDEEEGAEEEESIDEDIATADAEGFFDEDLDDEEADMEVEDMMGEDTGGELDEEADKSGDDGDDGGDGGKSFDELKEEYESGEADWSEAELAKMDEELDEMGEADLLGEDEPGDAKAAAAEESEAAGALPEGDDPAADEATGTEDTSVATDAAIADASGADADPGKPYLGTLPSGYAADLIVVEWLEYLIAESNVHETSQAIGYYERIDWVAEDVGEELRSYLAGFDDGAGAGDGTLTIDHHTQSLRYISQLSGDTADRVAMQLLHRGGGGDGVQR
jgi:flagellar protein FlaE